MDFTEYLNNMAHEVNEATVPADFNLLSYVEDADKMIQIRNKIAELGKKWGVHASFERAWGKNVAELQVEMQANKRHIGYTMHIGYNEQGYVTYCQFTPVSSTFNMPSVDDVYVLVRGMSNLFVRMNNFDLRTTITDLKL